MDYNGTVITSPYIETVSGSVSSVQLSIADADGIFTELGIVDGDNCRYVQFTVADVPSTGANGVISIKDSKGVIMWSWHIWVWEDDLTPVTITNATGYDYNILPVNLASTWDDGTKAHIKNWYYQWGRPTPLLGPAAYNSNTDAVSYGELSPSIASYAVYYLTSIRYPTKFFTYNSDGNCNWFGTKSYYNLWDAACTSTGNSDNVVVKTVYDPCPIGFCVPNGNTFTYFSLDNTLGDWNYGWKFKCNSSDTIGIFFPASGGKGYNYGIIASVGTSGSTWTSSATDQINAFYLVVKSYTIGTTYTYRASAYSIRPTQEQ